MEKLEYSLSFNTPAFIGNEQQEGQLRTPPFKALIRHWWRFVWVSKNGLDVDQMRKCESDLFGNVSGERNSSQQSKFRIRIPWEDGTVNEVHSGRYLLYGKIDKGNVKTSIATENSFALQIAVPRECVTEIDTTMALIHYYGSIGGRSRNGWGSIHLESQPRQLELSKISAYTRNWQVALDEGWPHAIGTDDRGPLIWQTATCQNWDQVMSKLSEIRKEISKSVKIFSNGRRWLSYPVKDITIREFEENNRRIPNALRFKVRIDPMNPQRVQGIIFFVPSVPSKVLGQYRSDIHTVWNHAFGQLDQGEFGVKRTNQ